MLVSSRHLFSLHNLNEESKMKTAIYKNEMTEKSTLIPSWPMCLHRPLNQNFSQISCAANQLNLTGFTWRDQTAPPRKQITHHPTWHLQRPQSSCLAACHAAKQHKTVFSKLKCRILNYDMGVTRGVAMGQLSAYIYTHTHFFPLIYLLFCKCHACKGLVKKKKWKWSHNLPTLKPS